MKKNTVREKLKSGRPSIGSWLTLPDPMAARLMAGVGFDWLTVEMEHTPIDIGTASQCFTAITDRGGIPLARVPWNTGENIKRVLDTGAWGVIIPMVNSRQEAESAVEGTRYQPIGNRSVGGQLHAASFGTDTSTYYARANEEVLLVVMIEHIKGVEAADEILSLPGIDTVFIGPNDLLNSMGKKPTFNSTDTDFLQAVGHVRETAKKYGVAPGIHVPNAEAAVARVEEGFQFIAVASEVGFMLAKAAETADALNLGGGGPAVAKY
jgi:4-hydroxy-2-oxoheptanedioate aldolase